MENRNPVLELQNAVWKSVCNGSLKKDYPLLLEQCRKDGISSYILNLFIVTAQAKLKNPTETYVKYHHPKELEREPVEIEKIKFVEKIPLKYRVYKILFFSLLFVIVVLWVMRSCESIGNQGNEVTVNFAQQKESVQSSTNSLKDDSTVNEQNIDSSAKSVIRENGGYVTDESKQILQLSVDKVKEEPAKIGRRKKTVRESVANTSENSKKKPVGKIHHIKSKDELFKEAKRNKDYSTIKTLADQGYVKAYVPLAQYYLKSTKTHGQARKYALKAQQAGVVGADKILEELELLDY